tara:strand:+ start:313 stop:495 length:183 start_codon:yes stop_codon:yes gene_type:complete
VKRRLANGGWPLSVEKPEKLGEVEEQSEDCTFIGTRQKDLRQNMLPCADINQSAVGAEFL